MAFNFSNGINHKIHSFKVHASMVFILRVVHSPPQTQNIFVTLEKICTHCKPFLLVSYLQPWANMNLFQVSMNFPIPDVSCKYNHTICCLLCLASFTQDNIFKIYSCHNIIDIYFYCQIIFHCMDIPYFLSIHQLVDIGHCCFCIFSSDGLCYYGYSGTSYCVNITFHFSQVC